MIIVIKSNGYKIFLPFTWRIIFRSYRKGLRNMSLTGEYQIRLK